VYKGFTIMSIYRIIRVAALEAAICLACACTSLPVTTDINPKASASVCHTYAWAQEHVASGARGGAYGNPLNADRLRAAIAYNLAARGLQPVEDRKDADCVIGYAIGSRVVADDFVGGYAGYGWGWGWGWGAGAWGPWGPWGYDYPYVHNEGRISVDLFDAHTHTAIWHASVNQNVTDLTGPSAEAKINEAAAAIFTKFPIPGGPVPAAPSSPRSNT
jgi:Domain of unknown function (DUF4136)